MKPCKDIQNQLADFAVGVLVERERAEVERHFQECPTCQRELSALQRTGAVLDALEPEEAPAGLWQSIRREIETPKQEPAHAPWWEMLFPAQWPRLAYAGLAATAILAVALLVTVSRLSPAEDDETQDFLQRHGMLAWNDPLSDKAALGVMLGRSGAGREMQ
ncbi:MAG: zf-HC2 domain-containing protein [Verrucomicrobia bacterium]|nr:zf-HC2 domain-containing protein [Verrucomicrobiota bacterium]